VTLPASAVAENMPGIPVTDDCQNSSVAVVKKDNARSWGNVVSPVSEARLTQMNSQSTDGNEELPSDFSENVEESSTDYCISPELTTASSLPASRRTRTASKPMKYTTRQTSQGLKSYSLRTRHSTSDGVSETQSGPSVPDLARFLTPQYNTDKGRVSNVYDFHSDGQEKSPRKLRGRCSGGHGDAKCEAEASFSAADTDIDYSFVFPLPPQVTRISSELEFLESDGRKGSDAKEDSPVSSHLRKRSVSNSSVDDGTEKLSDLLDKSVSGKLRKESSESKSVVGTDQSKISDGTEKPLLSRLRRSSDSKSSVEDGSEKVTDVPCEQLSRQSRSETRTNVDNVVAVAEWSCDVQEKSPVSSRLRRRTSSNPTADGIDLPSTDCMKASAVSPEKSSPCPAVVSSGDLEHDQSHGECSQPQKSISTAPTPLTPGNICRITDDTSFPVTLTPTSDVQNTALPKSSPFSSPDSPSTSGNGQPQRASFRLLVNLRSPKYDDIKRLSSGTSSLEGDADHWSDMSPKTSISTRRTRHSSQSTSPQSRSTTSAEPGSNRKLQPQPQRDTSTSENATRRSQRLIMRNANDVASSSSQPARTEAASANTQTRLTTVVFHVKPGFHYLS